MSANSKIEWCHHTFNPWRGCTHVSPGCEHCYAETLSKRNPGQLGTWGAGGTRVVASESYWRQPERWNRAAEEAGERHRVFCASLADVFEDRPELVAPRERLFELIYRTPHLDWLILTKRAAEMRRMVTEMLDRGDEAEGAGYPRSAAAPWPPPANVWLGVSVEDQRRADERIPLLLDTPAAVRFLSCEPLLGPVDLDLGRCESHDREYLWEDGRGELRCSECSADGWSGELSYGHWLDPVNGGIDWVIVGGESGHGARPMSIEWARALVEQCAAAEVACFVKQLGAGPYENVGPHRRVRWLELRDRKGGDPDEWPEDLRVREFPQPAAVDA